MKYLAFLVLILGLPLFAFAQSDTSFVPLTQIPFLTETGNAFSLETFLNGLYRIGIGIAAVAAVLQIMRAGIMYMGSDAGFAEKKEAKNLIALSIGGLILVLSPVIVFSIINPEILSLKINNIEALDVPLSPSTSTTTNTGGAGASCSTYEAQTIIPASGSCASLTPSGHTQISAQCCSGMAAGNQCCGKSKSAPTAPVATVTYGWRGVFENSQGARSTQQQGTFSSKALCEQSLSTWPAANNLLSTGEFSCNCNTPINQQSSCTGF